MESTSGKAAQRQRHSHHHHRHRRYKWLRRYPKSVTFSGTVLLAIAGGVGLVWLGVPFIPLSMGACFLAGRVAYVNDRKGFPTRRDRHAHEKLNAAETLFLGVLVIVNVTLIIWKSLI